MVELKTCPKCGGDAKRLRLPGGLMTKYVGCLDCCICSFAPDDVKAVEAWNARHERTCSFEWVEFPEGDEGWCCSNCGDVAFEFEDAPNYCPNCGARVIGGEE